VTARDHPTIHVTLDRVGGHPAHYISASASATSIADIAEPAWDIADGQILLQKSVETGGKA
jgi:hypothetical protein